MTIQQILNFVDEIYPNTTSPATKIAFLNTAMGELAREYGRYREIILATASVEEDTDIFALPTDCIDFSHIYSVWAGTRKMYDIGGIVSSSAFRAVLGGDAPAIDDYYNGQQFVAYDPTGATQVSTVLDYDGATHEVVLVDDWVTPPDSTYTWATPNMLHTLSDSEYIPYARISQQDNPKQSYTYFDVVNSTSDAAQQFGVYPSATVNNYPVKVRYKSRNDAYTVLDLAEEPDIDSRWHDALAYYIVYMCASIGQIPDPSIANFWAQKYEDSIDSYKMAQTRKEQVAPKRRKDNPQWGVRLY
jgi:hypothetical protein